LVGTRIGVFFFVLMLLLYSCRLVLYRTRYVTSAWIVLVYVLASNCSLVGDSDKYNSPRSSTLFESDSNWLGPSGTVAAQQLWYYYYIMLHLTGVCCDEISHEFEGAKILPDSWRSPLFWIGAIGHALMTVAKMGNG
jgi:hypothetical protein